ncbi:unnamed protein product, partial [Cylindrotheca closterium]
MAHVDFEALRGTQTVYKPGKNNSEFFKSSRQAQLDRNWENLNVKIDKREVIYTTNQYTVAAIITKHFITQAMRDKLSNETDWLDLKEDHVMLLKHIKTFMTITDETEWQHFGLMESLKRFTNCTQKQNESVNDYRRRFEAQADQVFEILGTDVLHVYATKTMGYLDLDDPEADPDDIKALQDKFKKQILGTFKASAFFYNCDRSRFQSMLDKANQTYAMEFKEYEQRNEYPTTIDQVAKALIKHKPDNRKKGPTTPRPTPSAPTASSSAPDGVSNAQAAARTTSSRPAFSCWCCGDTGHGVTCCPERSTSPQAEWRDPGRYSDASTTTTTTRRAGRANLQVPSTASAAQSDAASSVTGTQSTGQQHRSNMQRAVVDRSGHSTSGTTDVPGSYVVRGRSIADGQSNGRITGWNLAQVRVRPILKKKAVSTEDRGELLMQKWQAQLDAASTFKDDDSMVSDGSLNMQIYKSTSKMDSLKHCSQWTKDNKKPFKSNGSKHWDIDLGVHLDSGSTFSLRMNEDYAKPGTVSDLDYMFNYGTNTGQRDLHQQVESSIIEGRTCLLDTEAQCNLDNLSELVKLGSRVVMDTDIENSFIVTKGEQRMRYVHQNGLYTFVPDGRAESDEGSEYSECEYRECGNGDCDAIGVAHTECHKCGVIFCGRILKISYSDSHYCGIQTVRENIEGFTDKQVERANRTRSVYHMAGAPGVQAFCIAVRSGLFKNCNVNEEDAITAEKIYGPGSSVLKGKTKRPTPEGVRDDWIEIPKELLMHNLNVVLHIDLVFVNNSFGLTTIDGSVRYRCYIPLASRSKTALYDAIDKCFRIYNARDFTVEKIYCDGEFRPVFEPVKDELEVHMNYASRGEHDPKAERNNQHLKALFWVHFHRMPFKVIPKKLTVALMARVAKISNYYPAKGGLSAYYSPHMIMHQRMVDASNKFVAEIGAYVHGYGHDTKNNMAARTIEGVYMG